VPDEKEEENNGEKKTIPFISFICHLAAVLFILRSEIRCTTPCCSALVLEFI
jgi:hypothetical protein